MKHFDIDAYAKEKLEGDTLRPNATVWPKLLERLYEAEQKQRKRRYYVKGGAFLVILMLGLGFTNEGIGDQVSAPFIDTGIDFMDDVPEALYPSPKQTALKEKKRTLIKTTRDKEVSIMGHGTEGKTMGRESLSSDTDAQDQYDQAPMVDSKVSDRATSLEVTDAEIDDLMSKARENVERERAALKEMRRTLAIEMLAEIEKEIEHQKHRNSLSQNLKHGFVRLKDAIAN